MFGSAVRPYGEGVRAAAAKKSRMRTLLFRLRRRRILRRWAQGRIDYSGARLAIQRLAQ